MRTPSAKKNEVQRRWYVVDAAGRPLGRTASAVAKILRGKNKAIFTPHVDTGDFVIIVNAARVKLTGRKLDEKHYYHFSGWPGGMKAESARSVLKRKPTYIIREAVKGMLPKGPLGRQMLRKLKVYAGAEHPHAAQKPEPLALG